MYKLLESSNLPEDQQITFSLKENNDNEFVKLASLKDFPVEVDEAIKNLKRQPNHSYVLVTGMGDGETWSSNANGDYFPYDALLGMQNTRVWDEESPKDERLSSDMEPKLRYKTFEDAHFFHHHKNKIDRGDPSFGSVYKSFWFPRMRTVLMIIDVDGKKDPETADMIDAGETLKVSMGAKLPYDRCSICKKKNKRVVDYCPHLKFTMGRTLPDGRKVYSENLFPRFFDISKVTRPAFFAGLQLEKIASTNDMFSVDLAEYYDIGRFDKMASLDKKSELYKEIPTHVEGTISRVSSTEHDLPHAIMNDLAKMRPQEAWGALTNAGIIAKPNEFAYIILKNGGHDDMAEKFLKTNAVIKDPDVKGLDEKLQSLTEIEISHDAVKMAKAIPEKVLKERSISSLEDRIYETDKGMRKTAEVVRTIGVGSILSALYLLYRRNAKDAFNAYGLMGAGISQVLRSDIVTPKYIGNDAGIVDEMNKHAGFWNSGKGMVIRGMGGFVAPYIASAHYQNKMQNGEYVGTLGRFAANNPGKLGILGAAAASNPEAMYKGVKTMASDLGNAITHKK